MRLVAALAALVLGLPAVAAAQEPQTSLPDIEDEVMCPICGVTLELATEAPQAIQEREFIRERIAEGQTRTRSRTPWSPSSAPRCSPCPRPRASIWPRGSCPAP